MFLGFLACPQDMKDYPLIPGLPSYGRGRELPGPRHSSLINSEGLEDVVITGNSLVRLRYVSCWN
jgi:hypothetical protein